MFVRFYVFCFVCAVLLFGGSLMLPFGVVVNSIVLLILFSKVYHILTVEMDADTTALLATLRYNTVVTTALHDWNAGKYIT